MVGSRKCGQSRRVQQNIDKMTLGGQKGKEDSYMEQLGSGIPKAFVLGILIQPTNTW